MTVFDMIFTIAKMIRNVSLLPCSQIYHINYSGFSRVACLSGKTPLFTSGAKKRRAKKEVVAYKKVFGDSHAKKRRKKWLDDMTGVFPGNDATPKKSKPSVGTQRRAQQLNVILYDEINRILRSGQVGPELIPLDFHITMVDIALDFSVVNIRWEADGSERDAKVEQYLPQCTVNLRRALTSYKVMGSVPALQFVKDSRAFRIREVEQLLDIADMGPDYVRPELGRDMKVPKPVPHQTFQETISKAGLNFKDQEKVHTRVSPTGAMEVVTLGKDLEVEQTDAPLLIENDFADLEISSNAYDVDRSGYAAKIVQLKRQSVKRGVISVEHTSVGDMNETTMDTAQIKDIKKLLSARKGKQQSEGASLRKLKYKDHLTPWSLTEELDFGNDWRDTQDQFEEPHDFHEEDLEKRW